MTVGAGFIVVRGGQKDTNDKTTVFVCVLVMFVFRHKLLSQHVTYEYNWSKDTNMISRIKIFIYAIYFAAILRVLAHCTCMYGWSLLCYAYVFLGRRTSYKHEETTRFGSWWTSDSLAQRNVFSCCLYNELLLPEISNVAYGMG